MILILYGSNIIVTDPKTSADTNNGGMQQFIRL